MTDLLIAKVIHLRHRESGATAVEYALMVAFIALVIIVAVALLGNNLRTFFTDASTKI